MVPRKNNACPAGSVRPIYPANHITPETALRALPRPTIAAPTPPAFGLRTLALPALFISLPVLSAPRRTRAALGLPAFGLPAFGLPALSIPRRTIAALALLLAPVQATADQVTVFAAASLTNALDAVAAAWTAGTGHEAVISYAGASALARQIQQGAPADIFVSSSPDWMDALAASGDLRDGTRRDILGNTLVLIGHGDRTAVWRDGTPDHTPDRTPDRTLDGTLDLAGMLGDERLAMALVDSVPAGIYGKAALTSLGLWDEVAPLVAQADNVRAALAFVALNEAPLGIVYATDAGVEDSVSILGTFPPDSHPPITYPAAITAQSDSAVAADFLGYLTSDTARAIWTGYGFSVLP